MLRATLARANVRCLNASRNLRPGLTSHARTYAAASGEVRLRSSSHLACTRLTVARSSGEQGCMISTSRMTRRWCHSRASPCRSPMARSAQVRTLTTSSISCQLSGSSAVASHHHVRNSAGLFDVGHMVQSKYVLIHPLSSYPVLWEAWGHWLDASSTRMYDYDEASFSYGVCVDLERRTLSRGRAT